MFRIMIAITFFSVLSVNAQSVDSEDKIKLFEGSKGWMLDRGHSLVPIMPMTPEVLVTLKQTSEKGQGRITCVNSLRYKQELGDGRYGSQTIYLIFDLKDCHAPE